MLRKNSLFFIFCFSLWFHNHSIAQNLASGRPQTRFFSVDDYGSAPQIHDGIQLDDGTFLFGNDQDVLSFNGIEWKKIEADKLHTKKLVRDAVNDTRVNKFYKSSKNTVFVGRANNFGYLNYNSKGEICYFPLFYATPSESMGEVWSIYETKKGEIIFVGEDAIYRYVYNTLSKIELPQSFKEFKTITSCKIGNSAFLLYDFKKDERVKKYLSIDLITGKSREVSVPEFVAIKNIRGSVELNGKSYVFDYSGDVFVSEYTNGLYNWTKSEVFPPFTNFQPISILKHEDLLMIGTLGQGLVVTDPNGKVKRTFNFNDELGDLTVNNLFLDKEKNIWLCLENGIQFIETSNPLSFFKKKEGIISSVEAIDFKNGEPLIGLNSDLFGIKTEQTHQFFRSKECLKQWIFDVKTFETSQGKKTLVVGYDGIFEYIPSQNRYVSLQVAYGFKLTQDPKRLDDIYFTEGLGVSRLTLQKNGSWLYKSIVNDSGGETYSLSVFNNKIYFGVKKKGIGVFDLGTKTLKIIKIKNAESQNFYLEVFHNQLFVGTGDGIQVLSKNGKEFKLFQHNSDFFGSSTQNNIHRIINIDDQQLWVSVYKELKDGQFTFETGWMEEHNGSWKFIKWPLAGLQKAGVVSCISKDEKGDIWLGSNHGVFVLNTSAIKKSRGKLSVFIDKFEVNGKIRLYNINESSPLEALSYRDNSFRITFHSNSYSTIKPVQYRYKLEGFNDDWSDWSELNFANFQKIGEGTYTILIQARNFYGVESQLYSYEITILPPWYRTVWAFIIYFIALGFIIYFVVQLSTQRVKRQNIKLEETVQERTKEIAEQNHQLEQQKEEITQKTIDILDSIQYAKRIQNTILPSPTRLNELFHEHFVFYRPKDIVSGDFYWTREVGGKAIFSAVDCTGHGVPGSLVSIVGNNGLLRAVNEFKLTEPGDILNKLREIVVGAFKSDGQIDVKDGMDIALCSIDYTTDTLKFAGANNECVIIRNGEIFELKPDKQPIGEYIDPKPFTQKEFALQNGDCIYLYTDGYVDQFGGEKLKKLKSRPFKTMLLGLAELSMKEQYEAVQSKFDSWKGELDQVDDVCVFAVRYQQKLAK